MKKKIKSKLLLLGVMLLALFFIACPMPNVGPGASRTTMDGGAQTPTDGSPAISVVNDTERNQAVYINESGVQTDVAAAEFPGGPLVRCVSVVDFTVIPPSTDPDSLPVKALVAGTRDDGTPGVWQINNDDSIQLPQPEQTADNTARCIVGGETGSMPDGIQTRYGWSFKIIGMDARIIVGEAWNNNGVTIGGVQIKAGTRLGIYWRMYTLPFTKFYIVSTPRLIGTFQPQTLPARWRAAGHPFSDLLLQLRLYLKGTLSSYLTEPSAVTLVGSKLTGMDVVTGRDEFGLPALANIDSTAAVVSIAETLPDLEFGAWQGVPTTNQTLESPQAVSAVLTNAGVLAANAVTLTYYLSTSSTYSPTDSTSVRKQIGTPLAYASLAAGATATPNSITFTVGGLGFAQPADNTPCNYYLYAVGSANPAQNYNLDLGVVTPAAQITVAEPSATRDVVAVSAAGSTLADSSGNWNLGVSVTLNDVATTSGTLDVSVLSPGGAVVESTTGIAISSSVAGTLRSGASGGTYVVNITAHAGNSTAATASKILVKYQSIVVETYDPSGGGTGYNAIQVYGSDLAPIAGGQDESGSNGGANAGFALVNMTGLYPGRYYVKTYENPSQGSSDSEAYAIRVLTTPSTDYSGQTTADLSYADGWQADGTLTAPNTATPLPPTVSLGGHLFRYYPGEGADWVIVNLP